jgi:hypothetical protein
MTINLLELLNLNLALEVGRKEAQRPRRRKTRRPSLNAQIQLLWNTPDDAKLHSLLEERWNMGKRLIDEKKKAFGINISISSRNIRNRTHRGLQTAHHGAKSPLEEVEVALVEICIQMGKIRQPLSCTEAITLMNDMIENTDTNRN